MGPVRFVVGIAAVAVLLHAFPAMARPGNAERRCERTVAKASTKFLRAALSAPDDHASATAAFRKAVLNACPDAAVASIGFGGECGGSATGIALARCLIGSHEARTAFLGAMLGTDAPGAAKDLRKCRATFAGAVKATWLQLAHELHRCKQHPPAELTPGAECGTETVNRILEKQAQLFGRLSARIARFCTDELVVAAGFGTPCEHVGDTAETALCIIFEATDAAEQLTRTVHRDRGFCGDNRDRVEARIDALLAEMTPEEKISQMHGSTLSRGWRTAAIERLGVPGFGMLDGPRGVSGIAGGVGTAFPVGIARGATFNPVLEEAVGAAIGREVRAKGADVLLAPTLNIVRHPRGGRTQESYGEDTVHLGEMGAAFVRGAQRHVIASVKHFAVNSIENTRFVVDVDVDERALREVYLPHFQRVIAPGHPPVASAAAPVAGPFTLPTREHAASVMSAYNSMNGSYCSENVHLLRDVLKGDWRFQGFVESDWIFGTHSTVPALEAGLDIEMPSGQYFGTPLLDALASGAAAQADVDAAVRRALRAQFCFQLDTHPPVVDDTIPGNEDHAQLAQQVAEQAIVLLKNDGPTLPLARATTSSLVVVGTVADVANVGDTGSSSVVPPHVITPLDGITEAAGGATVTHIAGPPLDPADVEAIAAADAAIVVVGLTKDDEGEGQITHGDRDSLVLPRDQDAFVAAVAALNPRTIVVLQGSGPVLMPWLDEVPAVLETWYLGQEGGAALGEILFGDVAPTGKLPLSFPAAESDLPPFDNVSLTVTYDYWHGYRHLDRNGATPLFPFGFGLTYTSFGFSNLTVTPAQVPAGGHVRIAADITATGATGGTDVVQLYVGYQGSAVQRAPRDLKAFARVAAQPGTPTTVVFDLPTANLAYWDVAASQWVIEPVTYDVYVGDSSRDTPLVGSFTVTPF